jgi:hypothetical protein
VTTRTIAVLACLLPIGLAGCIDFDLNMLDSLFPQGTEYVVGGTSAVIDGDSGPCRVWFGDDGLTYYLFQNKGLENDLFDQVIAPGATARLVISTRSDLDAPCGVDAIVEVQDVLEIVGN